VVERLILKTAATNIARAIARSRGNSNYLGASHICKNIEDNDGPIPHSPFPIPHSQKALSLWENFKTDQLP